MIPHLYSDLDGRVRVTAFEWLSRQTKIYGDVLPRSFLETGFEFEGKFVPLVSPQGIFKPQILPEIPLSIATTPSGPYDDSFGEDGLLQYRYRGTNPRHRDNEGLRVAMLMRTPLIYFHGVVPGKYLAVWPVYVVGDHPGRLSFSVAADDMAFVHEGGGGEGLLLAESAEGPRRAYITAAVKQRLHQRGFRERVLLAYREQCACCRLRHPELLDAAHIIADSKPEGLPSIQNGISLCKLHHAAFDSHFLGIRPDYFMEVRKDILDEEDGPMLLHGLKDMNKRKIILPRRPELSPDKSLLEMRFEEFRRAS